MSGIMYTVDDVVNLSELWGNNMIVNINTLFKKKNKHPVWAAWYLWESMIQCLEE